MSTGRFNGIRKRRRCSRKRITSFFNRNSVFSYCFMAYSPVMKLFIKSVVFLNADMWGYISGKCKNYSIFPICAASAAVKLKLILRYDDNEKREPIKRFGSQFFKSNF